MPPSPAGRVRMQRRLSARVSPTPPKLARRRSPVRTRTETFSASPYLRVSASGLPSRPRRERFGGTWGRWSGDHSPTSRDGYDGRKPKIRPAHTKSQDHLERPGCGGEHRCNGPGFRCHRRQVWRWKGVGSKPPHQPSAFHVVRDWATLVTGTARRDTARAGPPWGTDTYLKTPFFSVCGGVSATSAPDRIMPSRRARNVLASGVAGPSAHV